MQIYENQWNVNERHWNSLKTDERQWKTMQIIENQCKSMKFIEINENKSNSMKIERNVWDFMIGVGRLPRFLERVSGSASGLCCGALQGAIAQPRGRTRNPLQKVRLGHGYNRPRLGLGRGRSLGLGRGSLLGLGRGRSLPKCMRFYDLSGRLLI